MIIDTSALIAILRQEEDAGIIAEAAGKAEKISISAATWFEAAIVADRFRAPSVGRRFDDICRELSLAVVPLDEAQARIAREAYRDFGKGSGHKAQLNFGDCFAYALAKTMNEPLLYKGTDFSQTDVRTAV
ncbi:MAG: type II toxin-antitoxin system VapC family toxin [Alphaproteobacteria bacterium]|jgi:ribonuclease VapC|nr:type II toxin-antitoxin system VapC family toxin [Alphaproteobacteria bacterium]